MTRSERWIPITPGEIVLLRFPFGNAAAARRRPAVVLLDTGDDDIVVARITSQVARDQFDIELEDWASAGLLLPSVLRVHKLATLEKRLVERRLGSVIGTDWNRVRELIQRLWAAI